MGINRSQSGQAGFTIIEAVVAAFILLVGIMATATLVDQANKTTVTTRVREAANNLARDVLEAGRGIPYEKLATATFPSALQNQPGLQDDVTGGAYTITRRSTQFTISGTVCIVDDPQDGIANPAGITDLCNPSAVATNPADRNPEDYKRLRLTVSWKTTSGQPRSVTQTTLVNNPGSASGPAVRALNIVVANTTTDATQTPVDQATWTNVHFEAQASAAPKTMNWFLDGVVQTPAPAVKNATVSKLVWQFDWPLTGVLDGTHVVTAEAYNQYGVSGPSRSMTVVLNRFAPLKPTGLVGGLDIFGWVELEWKPNSEGDIVGYTVTRQDGTEICSVTSDTGCVDTNPLPDANVNYVVKAWDTTTAGTLRAGPNSDVLTVSRANQPPEPATHLIATRNPDATVTLTWTKSVGDQNAGDTVDFYRIYRGGQTYNDRYDRWYDSSSTITYVDRKAAGAPRDYAVTASDGHFLESSFCTVSVPETAGTYTGCP